MLPKMLVRLASDEQVDLRTLQELMGHADMAMIPKVYARLADETDHSHDSLRKFAG